MDFPLAEESARTIWNRAKPKLAIMNNSKRTSINLNRNIGIVTPKAALTRSPGAIVAALLTLVVFTLLVKLGLWQLSRAEEKSQLEIELQQRALQAPQPLLDVLNVEHAAAFSVTGVRVETNVAPSALPIVLLDNQTWNGKVGYLAYQVMALMDEPGSYLLVELGFVDGGLQRQSLPKVQGFREPLFLTGRLYQKSVNPLSDQLHLELSDPIRVQNMVIADLSKQLNVSLIPTLFQPDNLTHWPYPQPWQPLNMGSQKHFAYAMQWFAMALVLLLISSMIFVRYLRIRRKEVSHDFHTK
ncbi:SURF1 family protein [Vibrio vulnificus]|nr:SURF1 family protein [Vibrio vulnificus]